MRLSICHYSFHRDIAAEKMGLPVYFRAVKDLGLDACDLHMRLTGDVDANYDTVMKGLEENGLTLSSYSFSNNFTQETGDDLREQIEMAKQGLRNARRLGTDTARIFGGYIGSNDESLLVKAKGVVTDALKECAEVAEEVKVTMALENHGGMPGTGEEVLSVIDAVGSDYLKACCDIGNFIGANQSPEDGTRIVAPVTAYVHVKDMAFVPGGEPRGRAERAFESATVGEGDVAVEACFRILKDTGYTGFLALEYEGREDETTGVKKSIDFMRKTLAAVEG